MKSVQFKSCIGQPEVFIPSAGLVFKNGEIKPVTDEQAAVLLTNGDFSEVEKPAAPAATKPEQAKE